MIKITRYKFPLRINFNFYFHFKFMKKTKESESPNKIEKMYQKKTQIEHILIRPDTYIGTVDMQEEKLWAYDENQDKFVNRTISYVPGLYKIFDEILVNASDNYHRNIDKFKF